MGWHNEDVVHHFSEFSQLDMGSLDPGLCGSRWSIGRGGNGLPDDQWSIKVPVGDGLDEVWHIWWMPPPLSAAINMIADVKERKGREGVQGAIISALGL